MYSSKMLALFIFYTRNVHYFESYSASNRLLQSILHDLKIQEYLAGVKALGLISKLLTCPLWHLLEDKSVNILDMNEKYQQLVTFLN